MTIILLSAMIKPTISYGRTNIYERINDYVKSFNRWNEIADDIPNKIYIFENSGYDFRFNLNPKITYISERIVADDHELGKGKSVALFMKYFLDVFNFPDDEKILFINGRYAPIYPLYDILKLIEDHDIVLSGFTKDHGPVDSRWHVTTVRILKEVIESCLNLCNDTHYNYEMNLKNVIDKHDAHYYMHPIDIIPTYEGGMNIYRTFI